MKPITTDQKSKTKKVPKMTESFPLTRSDPKQEDSTRSSTSITTLSKQDTTLVTSVKSEVSDCTSSSLGVKRVILDTPTNLITPKLKKPKEN